MSFGGSTSGVYPTTDGYVAIAAARRGQRDTIAGIIQEWTSQRYKADVVKTLTESGVPAAPVNTVDAMVADPQVQVREMFVERNHPRYGIVKITGSPLKMSKTPGRVERLAPLPGEHNTAIFMDMLGYSPGDLEQWQTDGILSLGETMAPERKVGEAPRLPSCDVITLALYSA